MLLNVKLKRYIILIQIMLYWQRRGSIPIDKSTLAVISAILKASAMNLKKWNYFTTRYLIWYGRRYSKKLHSLDISLRPWTSFIDHFPSSHIFVPSLNHWDEYIILHLKKTFWNFFILIFVRRAVFSASISVCCCWHIGT